MSGSNGADEHAKASGAVPPVEPETSKAPDGADAGVGKAPGPNRGTIIERFVSMASLRATPRPAPAGEPHASATPDTEKADTEKADTEKADTEKADTEKADTETAGTVADATPEPDAPAVTDAPAPEGAAAPARDEPAAAGLKPWELPTSAVPVRSPASANSLFAKPSAAAASPAPVPAPAAPPVGVDRSAEDDATPEPPVAREETPESAAVAQPVEEKQPVEENAPEPDPVDPKTDEPESIAPESIEPASAAGDSVADESVDENEADENEADEKAIEDEPGQDEPGQDEPVQDEPADTEASGAVDDSAPTIVIDMSALRQAEAARPADRSPDDSESEPTPVPATERPADVDLDAPTEIVPAITDDVPAAEPPAQPPAEPPAEPGGPAGPPSSGPPWRKIALAGGGVAAALAVLYGVDLAVTSGNVPRGVTVAGIEIGGKSVADAEALLRDDLGNRIQQTVAVTAGDTTAEIVPAQAGLDVDWEHTLDRIGSQPLNPFTRIASLFGSDEIGVASIRDDAALVSALDGVRASAERAPREGTVVFEGATPVAVSPLPGQKLDPQVAEDVFAERWAFGDVTLPVDTIAVTVTPEAVDRTLADIAIPAVASDVKVEGHDATVATLPRDRIGTILSFVPDGHGGLNPEYHSDAVVDFLRPQLAETEVEPKDARVVIEGSSPTVVPGVKGELVDWIKTLDVLPQLLTAPGDRTTPAVYAPAEPALTTEAAEKLGINEVIGEYTTGGFSYASGVNIRLAAAAIDGAVVKPGDTFSLNGYTGPRGSAQGYVESGIIEAGRPGTAVGGGISQLATTLYNATYFAGMEDVAHTEHSYYISRYPAAREATVFEGAIDLQFRNPFDTGVLIETIGTDSDITVRIWGTKKVDVQSVTGERTSYTSPNTVTLPAGDACIASSGGQGFTVSDTRTITDANTGEQISRTTRTVKYDPVPIVKCIEPEPEPEAKPERNPAGSESGSAPTTSARPQPGSAPTTSGAPTSESATAEPTAPAESEEAEASDAAE